MILRNRIALFKRCCNCGRLLAIGSFLSVTSRIVICSDCRFGKRERNHIT